MGTFLAAALAANGAFATGSPAFGEYPSAVEDGGKVVHVRLKSAENRTYASALRTAADDPPNFAGHYILASIGCGAGCIAVGVIDAKTGDVAMLPFTVSDWPLEVTDPLSFDRATHLLVVQGSRGERGHGKYVYDFDGHGFKLIAAENETK